MADPHGRETRPPSEAFRKARELGHEPLELSACGLVLAGLAILALVGISLALMYVLITYLAGPAQSNEQPAAMERFTPNQAVQLEQNRKRWQAILESYEWVDQEKGFARIPIDRAIDLLAERGMSAASASPPARNEP
jgi:hypothetical protein